MVSRPIPSRASDTRRQMPPGMDIRSDAGRNAGPATDPGSGPRGDARTGARHDTGAIEGTAGQARGGTAGAVSAATGVGAAGPGADRPDAAASRTGRKMTGAPTRALILDDNEVDILRLGKLCRKAGLNFDTDAARSIDEMRRQMDEVEYDIVFIDYHLGFETGLEALKALKTHPDQSAALAIMVTSVTSHSTAIEAMRGGCADYIVKEEMTVSSLQKSVASAIERQIVLAMTSEAQVLASALKATIDRFMRSCGPDTRELIGGLLAGITELKGDEIDPELRARLTMVERGCRDLVRFCDDIATLALTCRDDGTALSRLQ